MASRPPVSDRINESLSFGDNNREAHFRHRLLRTRTDRTPLRIGNARGPFFFEPAAGQTYAFSLSNLPK